MMEQVTDTSAIQGYIQPPTSPPLSSQSISSLLPPPTSVTTPLKTTRSLSDSIPVLSPSPRIKEPGQRLADENAIIATPSRAFRREGPHIRALSLQMPPQDPNIGTNFGQQKSNQEPREFTSPSSILPRHSRGLDFARAATNLHHSTLVDQSSPDSSPTITQKTLPGSSRRGSTVSMAMDSPRPSFGWASGPTDRVLFPRSVVSTNALTSEASSSSSGDDDDDYMRLDESDEAMVMTPYLRRPGGPQVVTPFKGPNQFNNGPIGNSPSTPTVGDKESQWSMRRSKRNSGTLPMPMPIDRQQRQTAAFGDDYFGPASLPRQNSLDQRTDKLHLTSSHESNEDSGFATPPATPSVVRRPVTRRSNMLPKSRNFARIRAQLQEETAPAECEAKREAEVVKQVLVNEAGVSDRKSSNATPSSPTLLPEILSNKLNAFATSEVDALGLASTSEDISMAAADARRSSNNREFWPHLYNSEAQTPPLPLFHSGRSSSNLSEDTRLPSPGTSTPPPPLSTVTSVMSEVKQESSSGFSAPNAPSASEISRKINKRRRDEDLDGTAIKRRAVSPGMSAQNSPVLGQSPASSSGLWGGPRLTRDRSGSVNGVDDKSTSNSSKGLPTPVLGPKRVGLQGMTDTNDGLMKMSIE